MHTRVYRVRPDYVFSLCLLAGVVNFLKSKPVGRYKYHSIPIDTNWISDSTTRVGSRFPYWITRYVLLICLFILRFPIKSYQFCCCCWCFFHSFVDGDNNNVITRKTPIITRTYDDIGFVYYVSVLFRSAITTTHVNTPRCPPNVVVG